jgi:enoyl-CoA hydratase
VTDESDEVLTEVEGSVGLITLNRPKAINSLNQQMVDALTAILTGWAEDDAVRAVVLSGAGERGLCAGGDVVSIYHSARKDGVEARRFWRDEYLLNAQIAEFPKPYVALMDGIVMGGGVGVSAHANTRVVTDTSKIAMPEVGIGFIPDVGGVYLLSRAPGGLGLHAALTGAPFSGADAIAMGFADHYVPHADVEDMVASLRGHQKEGAGPAKDAANLIATRSPIALSVTLEAVRRAANLETLKDVLTQDYRVSSASLLSHDLVEGIRAQLIDKDRSPKWSPAQLPAVTAADVEAYFTPVDDDLSF